MQFILTLLTGALIPFSLAPFNFWPLAIASLATLAIIWQKSNPKKAFKQGFYYGLGMFGFGVSWVFVSIHKFGNTNLFIATLITLLFITVLSLFIATQGYILKKFYKQSNFKYFCIGFPTAWVIFEWLRSWILTGFPWLYVGYSQTNFILNGYAPIIGVFGTSFIIAFIAGLICFLTKNYKKKKNQTVFLTFIILSIFISGKLLQNVSWNKVDDKEITVALLQGNISPFDKFLSKNPVKTVDQLYGKMTRENLDKDLILWPENALPMPLPYSQNYVNMLKNIAVNNNTNIILGIPILSENGENFYNSIAILGKTSAEYHKKRLVPFGDYLPFEKYLRGVIGFFDLPMSAFISGTNTKNDVIELEKTSLLPLVCYEVAYPQQIRNVLVNQDANVIVTISEDGWFGKSIGPNQHFQMVQMRALETQKYILRATTTGISAIISPNGKAEYTAPQFEKYVLEGKYKNITGITPFTYIGVNFIILVISLLFLIFANGRRVVNISI